VLIDPPKMARYTCGFRTALEPSAIVTHARSLTDIEWAVVEPQAYSLRLLGRQANRLRLEIWSELRGRTEDGKYGLSIAASNTADDAAAFFTWRAKIFEAFDGKLTSSSRLSVVRDW
jgi:hypothetical protein